MRVSRLQIENFRGIKKAELHFAGHTLLIGGNNVGKSTICEALDLVLGPDRLNRTPPVEEFDFRNAGYLNEDGETPVPIRIEAVLVDLTDDIKKLCAANLEFWHKADKRLLGEGDIANADDPNVELCLRLITVAQYDIEEDQFFAKTIYGRSDDDDDADPRSIPTKVKRAIGFLYLRTIRTGSRALSLERGTLLDNILRMKEARKGMWESIRQRLATLDPPIDADATELGPILDEIEARLAEYIAPGSEGRSTRLFVSQLTREHLRKTIAFFLTMGRGEEAVPFQQAGSGTLNTLLLALLTFIADLKKDNVIFAMEEPEIALPPHTQRRIANYLLEETSQCFVTSHSPYVIERFEPDGILKLNRDEHGTLSGTAIKLPAGMKAKNYRQNFRRAIAEAMLGQGVIVGDPIELRCEPSRSRSRYRRSPRTPAHFKLCSPGPARVAHFATRCRSAHPTGLRPACSPRRFTGKRTRHPFVADHVAQSPVQPSHVQTSCLERARLAAMAAFAGALAVGSAAPPGRRRLERQRQAKAEGKIKGRGTSPLENPVCTWGWRSTRLGAAVCREGAPCRADTGEVACLVRWTALVLDGAVS